MRTWASMAMVWLVACGTSTGNPVDGDDAPGVPGRNQPQEPQPPDNRGEGNTAGPYAFCDAHPRELDSLDEATPLGFTPADVLAFAEGEHETTIRWQPSELASYGPESGEHALSVRVTHAGGEARYVEYTPKQRPDGQENVASGNPGGGLFGFGDCASLAAVEIEVELEIDSDGGALAESASATLHASSTAWATSQIALDAAELDGAFAIESTRPQGFELERLTLELGLSPLGLRGSLDGLLELDAGDSAVASGVQFAAIGASCDDGQGLAIALDQPLDGIAGQDVLDLVAAATDLAAAWSDGSTTEVDLEPVHDGEPACAIFESAFVTSGAAPPLLRVRGRLRAQSTDARLNADWPVVIEASAADGGGPTEAALALDYDALGVIAAQDFARVIGIADLDPSGYDGFQIMLDLHVHPAAAGASATGSVGVNGFRLPECAMATPEPPMGAGSAGASGGSSSPGCPGADVTVLESLTF